MILFNNTNLPIDNIVDFDNINIRCFNIEFRNKTLDDINLLEEIKDILEVMVYQEDRCLITINHLLTAYENNKDYQYGDMLRGVFKGLLKTFIGAGHEIVIYTARGLIEPDMEELAEIEGIDLFNDQLLLMRHIKEHTM